MERFSVQDLVELDNSLISLQENKEYLLYAFRRKAEEYAIGSDGLSLEVLKNIVEKIYRTEAIELFCLEDCAIETYDSELWDLIDEFWEYVVRQLSIDLDDPSIIKKEFLIRNIAKSLQTVNKFTASYEEITSQYERLVKDTEFLKES